MLFGFNRLNSLLLFFQVLAEREKRLGGDVSSSTDELETKAKHKTAQHLLEEIRQAVNEANAKGWI